MNSSVSSMMKVPPLTNLNWKYQYRIIPSHYPPINFFEDLVDPTQMEEAFYIESLTNDRLLEEIGDLSLVRPEDRLSGPGSSIVMAAFTHIGKKTRFSDGSFGVYYAARELKTAIHETVYHRENFLKFTQEEPGHIDMRVYVGKIKKPLHDIRGDSFQAFYHPNDYQVSQAFAKNLRMQDSWGLVFNSVRDKGGECIAILRPPAVSTPMQTKHLAYVWDGVRITSIYEKTELLV